MRDGSAKRFLQRAAVRTQFPPFTWLYGALYRLAVRLCVRRLRRLRGVRAVYLRRGLAAGRPLYGLSDIDLLVMVDADPHGRTAAAVRYQYELLRRIVPMLPETGELEVYDPEQFRTLYERSAFYRHRFGQGRREWRRLWGEDVFAGLPPAGGEAPSLASEELRPGWNYLARELLPDDGRPAYLRRYVACKWMADAARAALAARGEGDGLSRDAALARGAEAFPCAAETLSQVRAWRGDLLSKEPIPVDAVLSTYLLLAREAAAGQVPGADELRKLRILAAPPEAIEALLPRGAMDSIRAACSALDGVDRVSLVPRLSFDPVAVLDMDPATMSGATIDAFDLVLVGRRLPPAAKLREANRALEPLGPTVSPFFCDGELAVSMRPGAGWTLKDRRRMPEFFACLASAGHFGAAGEVELERSFERADSLAFRARTLLGLFRKSEVFRLPTRSFLVLFWEAGRAAWLAAQDGRPVVEVPVTSGQVVDALALLAPAQEAVLRRLHGEYCREVRGEPSDAPRYAAWAAAFASKLERGLFAPEEPEVDLPEPARTELTISVAMVTRNRARRLARALESLVAQERPPDQVVVVDNASTDDTAAVARSFEGRLKLTVAREDCVGIPHARNASIGLCTGDIVAFLDDDCQADPRWLAELEAPFLKDPRIGAVGGSLMPNEEQRSLIARFFNARMRLAASREEARGR